MLNSKLNALATYFISEVNYYFSCICDSILASQECIFNHTEKRVVSNTYLAIYNLHYKYAWKSKHIKTIFSKMKPTLPCQDTNYIYWKKFFYHLEIDNIICTVLFHKTECYVLVNVYYSSIAASLKEYTWLYYEAVYMIHILYIMIWLPD